jgi:3-oxoacyl-[acyl-carrier-protein] synthase-1
VKTRAVVVAVGARSPLGLDAVSTAFLYRAGSIVMQQGPLCDPDGEPVALCALATLDPTAVGLGRAERLAVPALEEALEALGPGARAFRAKLFLCFDEHLGGDEIAAAGELAGKLGRRAESLLGSVEVATSTRGAAALGFALDDLVDDLERGRADVAVVGGIHTDYEPERIAALARAGRLLADGNLEALVPGEAAAFAVLARPATARAHGLVPLAELHAAATAFEKARPDNDEPAFEALALTSVLRKIGDALDDGLGAGWILSDLQFEPMRLYEMQSAFTRTRRSWCEPHQWDGPAQRLGWLGAAAMPMHLVLAAEAFRRGWAPHPVAVSLAGSDDGERAAVLLSAPG